MRRTVILSSGRARFRIGFDPDDVALTLKFPQCLVDAVRVCEASIDIAIGLRLKAIAANVGTARRKARIGAEIGWANGLNPC
jgi:hypothetical protein